MRRRVARRRARGVRSGVGSAGYAGMWAGLHVQAQSAQGMGAQKRGAAPLLGSGKAHGVGSQVWRRAGRGSSAPSRGVRALVECIRAKEIDVRVSRVDCRVHQVTATALEPVPGYISKI